MAAVTELLRPGLLDGVSILLGQADQAPGVAAGGPVESFAEAVGGGCAALGARVSECRTISARAHGVDGAGIEEAGLAEQTIDEAVRAALAGAGGIDVLVLDGASLYARVLNDGAAGEDAARIALRACLEAAWNVTRAVFTLAFLPAERSPRTRRIVYLAPAGGDRLGGDRLGAHADAARAGLENLARTLSVEWARHGITPVTIAPGEATTAGEVAALCAYLASPAGAYFSGAQLDLRGA